MIVKAFVETIVVPNRHGESPSIVQSIIEFDDYEKYIQFKKNFMADQEISGISIKRRIFQI